MSTSVGYGGSSEPEVHFGLGRNTTIRSLEILWPSGVRQVLEKPAADRLVEIEEPQ